MKIVSRFRLNDEVSGYVIEEEGLTYSVTDRGLYDQDIMEGLVKSGYKVLNYRCDIITPDGIHIKDLVEEPCTASEDEIQTMLDMADYAFSEAEAAGYFSRDVVLNEVKFKEPAATIHTREELVSYLEKCKRLTRYSFVAQDVRPLNSFVAKEALFTADELARDPEIKDLFKVIESRRKLRSYHSYKQLIDFLKGEGVLNEPYTADDIKAAYLAWGICGLKTQVIDYHLKVGVSSDIFARVEAAERYDGISGRVKEMCLLDKKGVIHYLGGEIDLSDCEDFSQELVSPIYESSYYDAMHTTSKWASEYCPILCLVSRYRARSYYELLDENGVSYSVRVDHDRIVLFDTRSVIHTSGFLFVCCMDGMYASINKVFTKEQYQKWNLVMAKARDVVRAKTMKLPIQNSFDLLISEGVTPEAAVKYIARRISEDGNLNADYQTGIDYTRAHLIYGEGPSRELIHKYNPNGFEYSNLDSLIEIMCATRDEKEEKGEYLLVAKEDNGSEAAFVREEISQRPLENLEFVKMVKEGEISIDNLYQGKLSDGQADIDLIANLIELIIRVENSNEISIPEFIEKVRGIDETSLFNFSSVIKERNAAYKGYLKDRAILNSARATQATALVYITRVFREIANLPVDKQRHYMMECVSISLDAKSVEENMLRAITAAITDALSSNSEIPN